MGLRFFLLYGKYIPLISRTMLLCDQCDYKGSKRALHKHKKTKHKEIESKPVIMEDPSLLPLALHTSAIVAKRSSPPLHHYGDNSMT